MSDKKPIFHPMPGRVAVVPYTSDRVGSLVLPISAQRSRVMGVVLAIGGDESEGDVYDLKEGDRVLFGQNAGVRVEVNRTEVIFLRTSEIISRVEWEGATIRGVAEGVWDGVPDE